MPASTAKVKRHLSYIFIHIYSAIGTELVRHTKEATAAVHRYCKLVSALDSFISRDASPPVEETTTNAELQRARGKLERGLERLRRAGLRVLDASQVQNQDVRHAATSLLEVIATALEDSLQVNARSLYSFC